MVWVSHKFELKKMPVEKQSKKRKVSKGAQKLQRCIGFLNKKDKEWAKKHYDVLDEVAFELNLDPVEKFNVELNRFERVVPSSYHLLSGILGYLEDLEYSDLDDDEDEKEKVDDVVSTLLKLK